MATTRSKTAAGDAVATATGVANNSNSETVIRQRPREGSRSRTVDDVYDAKFAVDLATTTVDENVFLFVPNLIGYARVVLAAASLYFMPDHPNFCTLLYGVSCLLDAVDGQAARALDQTSKFGAVLDMVTDRCTTACLLCFLAATPAYNKYALLFQFLISLDFSSHYIHMYSSLVTGSSSHKKITQDVSRILWYYYNDSRTLFLFCFGNELFFVCLYLNALKSSPTNAAATFVLPRALFKAYPQLLSIPLLNLATLNWAQLIGAICFPIALGKQIISVVQFWKASKILVGIDLIERRSAREAQAKADAVTAALQ